MVWYFRHYGRLTAKSENYKKNAQKSRISKSLDVKEIPISSFLWGHVVIWKRKSNPLFSLLSAALALTHFLSLLLPPLNRAPHTVQSKGQYVFVFMYTYKWPYEKNAVLLGNWESFWLQFVELRPMNNPSTLLGWKDRVRTFELDKVSLSWLGACWALLSQPDAESSWSRHPQLRSSALCEYNSLELRVQQSWEFRASIGRKRSIRSIPSLTHQHHRLWCLGLDEKWFDGFAW